MNNICPNCELSTPKIFYEQKNIPAQDCILYSSQEEAQKVKRGNISLGFCENCGFIGNSEFNRSLLDYSQKYEDQQSFSPTFNSFSKNLAKRLIKKFGLKNKTITEIGCGKGDFLSLICEMGNNKGIGIDPALIKERVAGTAKIKAINEYFSEKHSKHLGDFVICRHTLEHIKETKEFLKKIRKAIGTKETTLFFDLPDTKRILNEAAFWDIYYEHCSYFTQESILYLFGSCGFEITEFYLDYNNQYIMIEAKPYKNTCQIKNNLSELKSLTNEFSNKSKLLVQEWQNKIKKNGKIAVWGSGSKCVSFISSTNAKDQIDCIVDINPYRHGKFIPGIAKKILPPEELKKAYPDLIIIMNSIYEEEIKKQINEMNLEAKILSL